MVLIEAKGIRRSYGNLAVLKGIDMTVEKGEIVAVVGASGAGKSTLLHILGTLDKPDDGSALFDGTPLFSSRHSELAVFGTKYIGFVFLFHNMLGEFTALENVCIPAFIGTVGDEEEIKNRA